MIPCAKPVHRRLTRATGRNEFARPDWEANLAANATGRVPTGASRIDTQILDLIRLHRGPHHDGGLLRQTYRS